MGKNWWIIPASIVGYIVYKKYVLSRTFSVFFKTIDFSTMSFLNPTLNLVVQVNNPTDITAEIQNIRGDLFVDNIKVGYVVGITPTTLQTGSAILKIPVTLSYTGVAELIKKFNSSVDVKDIKDSIEHYSDLIHDFLIRHPKANDIWKNCYNNFVLFLQGNPTDKINIDLDINEIYNGIKIELNRIGGVSLILKRFQHRIKYDMIQAIANNDPEYRQVDTTGEPTGSGKCTAYPLSWWQNCPAGKAPVGSRGWNSNGACNKWYQHISGELLCSDYKTNFDKPIKGPCVTAIGILDPSEETRRFVSNTLTSILDIVGLYPGAAATLKTISCIFTLALPIMGDWEWILKDLKDVCYNYICDGNTTDKVCGGAQKYCVPRYTDSEIANRDCSVDDTNCNKTVNGICTDELPKNEIKTFTTSKQHVLKPSNFI